ncbi:hypothetical protein M5689_006451 [Euphorbia peplus]|nr:hypothetical protein M5689_006451 [Euphorbia peplus]
MSILEKTASRIFHEVLRVMIQFSIYLIKPKDQTFATTPAEILNDERYMPYFKDCIGAIDGTHVLACVNEKEIVRFIGRKGMATQNIMAACSFDMLFTFVLAGWEGTAHDSRLFQYAINKKEINFPKPPPGKYYLRDIVVASMALHNYIRKNTLGDPGFDRLDVYPDFVPFDSLSSSDDVDTNENREESGSTQMNVLRDQIAFTLFRDKK